MARIFTSGFELNTLASFMEWLSISGSPTVSTTHARSGTYALKALAASNTNYVVYDPPANISTNTWFFRFYLYIVALPSADTTIFAQYNLAANHSEAIILRTTGALQLVTFDNTPTKTQLGSDSAALITGQWYQIELSVIGASGADVLKINGVQVATGTGHSSGDNEIALGMGVDDVAVTSGELWIDDFAMNDSTGSSQTSFPGNGKVIVLRPNAAGDVNTFATQTGGTAGSCNNFTRVNEVTPDSATTFNGSSTLNQEDLFNMDNSGIGLGDTVNVVHVDSFNRNSTADATATLKVEIEKAAAGTIAQGTAVVPNSTTFKRRIGDTHSLTLYKDPDNVSAWTQTTLDSMQAGYKLTTGPGTAGRRIDVSALWVTVDYTPAIVAKIYQTIQSINMSSVY